MAGLANITGILADFAARVMHAFGVPVHETETVARGRAIVSTATGHHAVWMHPLDLVEMKAGRDLDARLDGALTYLTNRACDQLDAAARRLLADHERFR
jgi:hypothetical protein